MKYKKFSKIIEDQIVKFGYYYWILLSLQNNAMTLLSNGEIAKRNRARYLKNRLYSRSIFLTTAIS